MNNYTFSQPTSFGVYSPFGSSSTTGSSKTTTNSTVKPFASSFGTSFGTSFGSGSTGTTFGSPPQKQASLGKTTVPSFASTFPNGFPNTFGTPIAAPAPLQQEDASKSQQACVAPIVVSTDDQRSGIPKSQNFIRVWKRTPSDIVSTNKILALLSSQYLNEDVDLFTLENLSYQLSNETKTMITIGPLALLSFVDSSVVFDLPPLQLVFVKFLRELLKEDVVTTIDKAWKFVEDAAQFMGLTKLLEYISLVKLCKSSISKQSTEVDDDTAFALALHYLLTNPDPKDAIVASRTCSKKVSKLTTDMVMASYGLEWLMKDKLCDYVKKHQESYKLLC
jgi:hypothetical protein